MSKDISPRYLMKLIADIESVLWDLFPTSKYKNVRFYIEKWHECDDYNINNPWQNFNIYEDSNGNIDLLRTLHDINAETLLKIAIDLGVETPDFIPCIPTFRNEIKAEYQSVSSVLEKAYKQLEEHPDIAIGLANSALESIIKEILKDERINSKVNSSKTLYELTIQILKSFQIFPDSEMPLEIRTLGSSLLSISKSIEKIRSEKTDFHGKTIEDHKIEDSLYAYFIFNCVSAVSLFLNSYYKIKFSKSDLQQIPSDKEDDLPF